METMKPVDIEVGSSTLQAVPAVHFQAGFALQVNRACCDSSRRPNAIAVELGPLGAAAARMWFGELGIRPGKRTRLPCMLGLVKRNRFLRTSMRERSLELQHETGKDLSVLPPTLLREELGLSSSSVLVLSPTDSIVEAIRCSCELDVPLYGVDLDEMADPVYPNRVLPDPAGTYGDLSADLRRFAASAPDDPEVDRRREEAMAARLKGLLDRHGRVLFTGGMAHWDRIERLLADEAIRPSVKGLDSGVPPDLQAFRRVIVHPAVAVAHMDAFPGVALAFERRRRHPLLDPPARHRPIRRGKIFQTLLRKAYRRHFSCSSDGEMSSRKRSDWLGSIAFEQLLRGETLVNLRAQPTLALVDACARATLSEEFRDVLRRAFIEFPWVDPKTIPGCGHLRPALAGEGTAGQLMLGDNETGKGEIQVPSLLPGGASGPEAFPMPDGWRDTVALEQRASWYRFTWRPWEDLINGLCAMAIAGSLRQRRKPVSEPFAGQLLDGIDVKATLRDQSRGDEKIWVRDTRLRGSDVPPELPEGFPVVWIFDEDSCNDGINRNWSTYFEPIEWLANFTGDPAAFRRLLRNPGDGIVDLVTYGRPSPVSEPRHAQTGIGHEILSGLVVFSPIFPTYRQTVSWFHATGASHNPTAWCWGAGGGYSLVRDLAMRADPALRDAHWQDLLIGMAIRFAGQTLTVVAPQGFMLSPAVSQAAARSCKNIRVVPANDLPHDLLQRIVHYYVLPGRLDKEGRTEYIPEAEGILGEPKDRYRSLVPMSWRTFGLET